MPVSGAFIRMAGHWVDEAFGFWAGWNFFIYEALLIPFEISALNLVLTFWRDDIPVEAVVAACIVIYLYGLTFSHSFLFSIFDSFLALKTKRSANMLAND
jgi:amino acid permease